MTVAYTLPVTPSAVELAYMEELVKQLEQHP